MARFPTEHPMSPAASAEAGAATSRPPARGPVGYVLKCYPRFSETFIAREVIAREAAGERIVLASLRAPRDPRFHALLGRVQAPVTWIPDEGRTLTRTWEGLRRLTALGAAPPGAALQALVEEEPEVAAQAVLVAGWALENRAVHLHAHFATVAGRTTRLAAALTGLPWSVTAHAKDIFSQEYDPHRRAQVLTAAGTVVAVSDSTAAYLRGRFPTAKVRRIYNGVELDELRPRATRPAAAAEADAGEPDRPPSIAAVGRLVAKKGWPVLLDALARLRDDGLSVRTTLVGGGPLEADLRGRRDALGLTDLVDLPGPLPQHDVLDLVRSATVLAAPCVVSPDGDRDGLPTVLLEAMAVGTPVVSTPVSGVDEAVVHERTGLLTEPGDPRMLAQALRRLLGDAALRERLAHAARAHVEERFDVATQARRLRELTEEIAARRRPEASTRRNPPQAAAAVADGSAA